MKMLIIVLTLSLMGCASLIGNAPIEKMTAEQIREMSKIKDANILCIVANSPYGKGSALFLNVDKGVVPNGTVMCDDACKCSVTNTAPAKTP